MADFNIYSIDDWAASTSYSKNKILKNNNLFYYVLANSYTSSSSVSTDISNGNLGGYITDKGESKPLFLWKPAYSFSVDNQPKIKTIQFGDSYKQIVKDGILNILPSLNLEFESDLAEITAILHFLETRSGAESFVYLAPAPRGNVGRWTCSKWTDSQIFYNNYKIQCVFDRSIV